MMKTGLENSMRGGFRVGGFRVGEFRGNSKVEESKDERNKYNYLIDSEDNRKQKTDDWNMSSD
jgi:hypothetical protein